MSIGYRKPSQNYTYPQMAQWLERNWSDTVWTDIPFDAGNFTASGAMTWTVAAGDMIQHRYRLVAANLALYEIAFNSTTIGGVADTTCYVTLPTLLTAGSFSGRFTTAQNGAVMMPVQFYILAASNVITFNQCSTTAWSAGAFTFRDQIFITL